MKLTVEIVQDKWSFSYQVGENSHTSTRPIDAESLCAFTQILKYASEASSYENKKIWDGISAKAWMEGHAQESLDFIKEYINKKKV